MKVRTDKKKKIIHRTKKVYSAICLFLLLTFFLSACSFFGTSIPDLAGELTTTAPEGVKTEDTTFRLPYSLTDTLDIYEVESRVNSDLMSLCYSGLVRVNSSWDA